jgi:hypothetical protein
MVMTDEPPEYVRTTITIPADIKARMDASKSASNWSAIASQAFEEHLLRLEGAKMVTMERAAVERLIDLALGFVKETRELLEKHESTRANNPENRLSDRQHEATTRTKQLQLDYWLALRKTVTERKSNLKLNDARPQHWLTVHTGRGGFGLAALVNGKEDYINVELFIQGANAKKYFERLEAQKAEIEKGIGAPLDWRALPRKKSCRILLIRSGSFRDRTRWAEQHKWLLETLERFDSVFRPRIESL